MANLERSKTRVKGFKDAEMDFQLMRQLGSCTYGGASVGECLALVDRIEDGDPARQFGAFCEGVGGPVALHRFTAAEGADTHCQVGNVSYAAAACLDWLDETLA